MKRAGIYSPEEEILINERYVDLTHSCEKVCKNEQDWDNINKAYFLAKEAHKGVQRKSGEPYITHPIAVAKIVVDEIGLGVKSVIASLLHDVVEDTDYTVEDIEKQFGPKIASMVDGLTKMAGVFNADASEQAEYFRKVLLTLSDDVRVILIKIADRLHNMRTLDSMPVHKQVKVTSETIYLFAPLAHRLGLYAIKSELENLSLKYRFPEEYENIENKLAETSTSRSTFVKKFNAPIIERLNVKGIEFEISEREKSVYSIWSKMQRKQIPFEEVYDLFAIRIVFKPKSADDEKTECWNIYSMVTDIYMPKPDRIRDWISIPKANGYEALHATVMGPDGGWAEVQIRSERMDDIAERGFAAHWKYKKQEIGDDDGEFDQWLRKIREALSGTTDNALEFLDNFKMSLYTTEIVIFTPKGESREMPHGSTALDFAYEIHTKLGHRAIGAKINHKIESIFTPLSSGDQIQIVTSDNAHPTVEWLKHVTTPKAKQSIRNYLKKSRENSIEYGIELFEKKMREFGIPLSARLFRKILPAYDCTSKDEFYSELGAGIISLEGIEKVLRENSQNKLLKFWTLQLAKPFKIFGIGEPKTKQNSGVVVKQNGAISTDSSDEPEFEIAECCNPIPGDDVVGYKDQEINIIFVHKISCREFTRLASQQGNNIVPVKWASHKVNSYLAVLEVRGIDRMGMLLELSQVISGELSINIRKLDIQSHDGIFYGHISLYVKDIDALNMTIRKVQAIKGVEKIVRVNPNNDNAHE